MTRGSCFRFLFCLLLAVALFTPTAGLAASNDYFVYVGTYTRDQGKGILLYRYDGASGKLTPLGVAAELPNPSFLAVHPNRKFLYAVSEIQQFEGQKTGTVSAYAINPDGKLTFLNRMATGSPGPCHVSVDRTGKNVLVANYHGGSVTVLRINETGGLGEMSAFVQHTGSSVHSRQQSAHAHSVNLSFDNRFVVVPDLGLDQVLVYRLNGADGSLVANDPPFVKVAPGAGPRHFVFHPAGKFAYSINELQSTITAFQWNAARGVLSEIQSVSTLPKDFTGTSTTAEVEVHPSGKFLYGSNRGHESIAVFSIDSKKGTLTPIEYVPTQGKRPRNFALDPSGRYLIAANQDTNTLVVFRVDAKSGRLTPTGEKQDVGSPVCITFVPVK